MLSWKYTKTSITYILKIKAAIMKAEQNRAKSVRSDRNEGSSQKLGEDKIIKLLRMYMYNLHW